MRVTWQAERARFYTGRLNSSLRAGAPSLRASVPRAGRPRVPSSRPACASRWSSSVACSFWQVAACLRLRHRRGPLCHPRPSCCRSSPRRLPALPSSGAAPAADGGGAQHLQFPHFGQGAAGPIGKRDEAGRDAAVDEPACRLRALLDRLQHDRAAAARRRVDSRQQQRAGSVRGRVQEEHRLRGDEAGGRQDVARRTLHGHGGPCWRQGAGMSRAINRACAQLGEGAAPALPQARPTFESVGAWKYWLSSENCSTSRRSSAMRASAVPIARQSSQRGSPQGWRV